MQRRRGTRTPAIALLAAGAWVAGCAADTVAPEPFQPPARYRVQATAGGVDAGLRIDCALDLVFEWTGLERLEQSGRVYVSSGGGEAERAVTRPDGTGLAFMPLLVVEEHFLRMRPGGAIVLESPVDVDTGVPFYLGLGRMEGVVTGPSTAEGTWSCAPLESPADPVGTVQGTWTLAPVG